MPTPAAVYMGSVVFSSGTAGGGGGGGGGDGGGGGGGGGAFEEAEKEIEAEIEEDPGECDETLVSALLAPTIAVSSRTMRFNFTTLEADPTAVSRTHDYESTPNDLMGSFALRVLQNDDGDIAPVKEGREEGGSSDVDLPSWLIQPITSLEIINEALKKEPKKAPPRPRETSSSPNVINVALMIQRGRLRWEIMFGSRVASLSASVTEDGALELRTTDVLKEEHEMFDFGRIPLRKTHPIVKMEPGGGDASEVPKTTHPVVVKAEPGGGGDAGGAGGGVPIMKPGHMTRLPAVLRSDPGAATTLLKNRGGEIVMRGMDEQGHSFLLRLYVVIGAHDPGPGDGVREFVTGIGSGEFTRVPLAVPGMRASSVEARRRWKNMSPIVGFRTFLMGTSTSDETSKEVHKLRGAEMALNTIAVHSGAMPNWDELTRRVDIARSRCFGKTLEFLCSSVPLGARKPPFLFPPTHVMVEEYVRFLKLKHKVKDYASQILSPPMIADPITGVKLLDEVWHIHISMPSYDADCRALTGGHVVQHVPALAEHAMIRYEHTWSELEDDKSWCDAYAVERRLLTGTPLLEANQELMRIWPEPEYDDDSYDDGCC